MQDPETMTGEGGLQPARGTANRGTEAWPSHPPLELHPALRPDHGIGHHYPLPETQGVFPDSKPHLQPTCESWAFAHKSPQTWALGHLHPAPSPPSSLPPVHCPRPRGRWPETLPPDRDGAPSRRSVNPAPCTGQTSVSVFHTRGSAAPWSPRLG